jgi:putative sigma-54 modulation protein
MNVEYTGRQTTITKKLKLQAEAGLERIAKIVGSSANVHVILTTDKYRHNAEVTVQTRHQKLVASCEATEMEIALHDTLAKLEKQAIRHKKKFGTIKRHPKADVKGEIAEVVTPAPRKVAAVKIAAVKIATKTSVGRKAVPMLVHSFPSQSPLAEPHIVRSTDGIALRPMSLEEAVKEAAFRDRDVFVFRDHGGRAMVLHRKRDGKMELIEVP